MLRQVLILLSLIFATPGAGPAWAHSMESPAASSISVSRPFGVRIGAPFSLIDQNDRVASDSDFRNTPMLIYFGYTNCPDTCPLDAQRITEVVGLLDELGVEVTPLFITVDPQRDTPIRLKEFLSAFHPRFVGLTGPADDIAKLAAAYGAGADRINQTSADRYGVLHPALAYLMAGSGEFLDFIHLKDAPDLIAKEITSRLAEKR